MQTQNAKILIAVKSTNTYATGIEWGSARIGHPEGSIKDHIQQLENNLDTIQDIIPEEYLDKLRLLIHTHDSFKYLSGEGVRLEDPKSHASLAAEFLSKYTDDQDLINIAQYHDAAFAAWCDYAYRAKNDNPSFIKALEKISDLKLFSLFLLIDGITEGKHTQPLDWALARISQSAELPEYIYESFERLAVNSRNRQEEIRSCIPISTRKTFSGIDHITVGPIETWGSNIYIQTEKNITEISTCLQQLAERTGKRYALIIAELDNKSELNHFHLHLSRYPGRAGIEVASISSFRESASEIANQLTNSGIVVLSKAEEEIPDKGGVLRATIGLMEADGENKKKALLSLIYSNKINSLKEAMLVLNAQFDLEQYQVDLNNITTMSELFTKLEQTSFCLTHKQSEADLIAGPDVFVQPAKILSVGPANDIYQEDCIVLHGSGNQVRTKIFKIAKSFRQVRFTLESLTARETVNIELSEFSGEKAAEI